MPNQPPILDLTSALEAMGDDREMYQEILGFYLDTVPTLFNDMETGVQQNDRETVSRHAHSLKSSSRSIGAMKLGSSAETLEHDANAISWESARAAIAQIKMEFNELRSTLIAEGFSILEGENSGNTE